MAVLVAKTRKEEEVVVVSSSSSSSSLLFFFSFSFSSSPSPRSAAIGLGRLLASPSGSHASQASPPQSLQSVPRSHLTSRVGEEEEEVESSPETLSSLPSLLPSRRRLRGKRNLPSSQRPSLAEGHESSQTRTRTRGWAHGGRLGLDAKEREGARRPRDETGERGRSRGRGQGEHE